MTPRAQCDWRHERDKHGVVHRAWSLPHVRTAGGNRLWHVWCRGGTRAVTVVPDTVGLTCFWCLKMSFNEKED